MHVFEINVDVMTAEARKRNYDAINRFLGIDDVTLWNWALAIGFPEFS